MLIDIDVNFIYMENVFQSFIEGCSESNLFKQAKINAKALDIRWDNSIITILKVLKKHPELCPKRVKLSNEDKNNNISLLQKWLIKYN